MTKRFTMTTCVRCPQTFRQWSGNRKMLLCRDCRAVMNARERAIWEGRVSTPTGVEVIDCGECGTKHPESREHCLGCGKATLFGHDFCGVSFGYSTED